ncbi:hypothetical protein [Parabacteroides sp. PF5-9]|uniref:hypothetical protein n=1 Tax=Parabacteroides sp. PF5-9 TaxID=1742404 RepID=UPI002476C4BF|nr:hypothetical protein [Parabacteroides sp. PF5-9]MDH6357788.1 hypothetical protein [Parabacteroides sp. PF5-9]
MDNLFEQIIIETKKSIRDYGSVYSALEKKTKNGAFESYTFLKFLNIWNDVEVNDDSKVSFYADFTHTENECLNAGKEKITCCREKTFIGDGMDDFWGDFLFPFYNKGKMRNDAFEVHFNLPSDEIAIDYYHSSIIRDNDNRIDIEHSRILEKKLEEANLKDDYGIWLKKIKDSYPISDNDASKNITRFYFFISPCYLNDVEEIYRVKANVGIHFVGKELEARREIRDFINQLANFINDLTTLILYNLKENELIQFAIRASLAQAMARNLSHNIGSHVFANLIGDGIHTDLSSKIDKDTYISQCSKHQDCDHQLAYFNQYLKSRFDYLSEVTFGVSNILTTKGLYKDVLLEFDRVRLLLNHISGINDFKYQFRLTYNDEVLSEDKDIFAAFPSDVLGCQAFYNIVENIIRNTAKHAKKNTSTKTFTINIKDIPSGEINLPPDFEQYYCVEIDDGISVPKIDELIRNQNERLNYSILDNSENHKLRNQSLGLLEMEASAAFLRQIDMPEIESTEYDVECENNNYANESRKFNLIKAFKTKNNSLGYRFFIKKPQEFLFVGDWAVSTERKEKLINQGVWVKTEKELIDDLKKGIAFAHRFIISTKNEGEFFIDELFDKKYAYKTLLPNRWIKVVDLDAMNELLKNKSDILDIEAEIWEIFNKQNGIANIAEKCKVTSCLKKEPILTDGQIILLDHIEDQEKEYQQFISQRKTSPSVETWIEPLSSNAQRKLPFFQDRLARYEVRLRNDKEEKTVIAKSLLWDCYKTKILVVDERIKEHSESTYAGAKEVKNKLIFSNSGVIITDEDLNKSTLEKNIIKNIGAEIVKYEPDFLLIHYGILERACNNDKKAIQDILRDWTENKNCKVVVTSGRGKHSLELPEYVRYLNLSSVLYAFVENQNKYSINYILNQARR